MGAFYLNKFVMLKASEQKRWGFVSKMLQVCFQHDNLRDLFIWLFGDLLIWIVVFFKRLTVLLLNCVGMLSA